MCVRRWSKSPDIVAALFVQAVVGEVHEQVLNVLWSPVVLDCGKPADGQSLFSQDKKKHCTCHSADISAVTTTFKDLTHEWMIEALGGEINIWQHLREVDATCAIIRIPGHTLHTRIPAQLQKSNRGRIQIFFSLDLWQKVDNQDDKQEGSGSPAHASRWERTEEPFLPQIITSLFRHQNLSAASSSINNLFLLWTPTSYKYSAITPGGTATFHDLILQMEQ